MAYVRQALSGAWWEEADETSSGAASSNLSDIWATWAEFLANPAAFKDAQEKAQQLLSQVWPPLDSEFRRMYAACDPLIKSIRTANFNYGESLMKQLNSYSTLFNNLYNSIKSAKYVEDITKYVQDLKKVVENINSFYNNVYKLSQMTPDQLAKLSPPGTLDQLVSFAKFGIIAGLIFMGLKIGSGFVGTSKSVKEV